MRIGLAPDGDHLDPAGVEVAGAVGEPDGGLLRRALADLLEGHFAGEGLAAGVHLAGVLAERGAAADRDGRAVGLGDELPLPRATGIVG